MTNRTLTSIVLRLAGLLLFMKIFDHFGSYFLSLYMTSVIPIFEEQLHQPLNKFYYNGTFLIISNIIISFLLLFKAEAISKRLIKNDSEIQIQLTKEDLIKSVVLIIGITWVAQTIYLFADALDYTIQLVKKLNGNETVELSNFPIIKYILKGIIAVMFIFKVQKISNYLMKK